MRCATACFMTRALLTTWGRNIRPDPNRSPTMSMPGHQRPLDDLQRPRRAPAAPPRCPRRCTRRCPRPARASAARRPGAPARPGRRRVRSWPRRPRSAGRSRAAARSRPARRLSTTSSTRSRRSGLDVVVLRQRARVDDRHVHARRGSRGTGTRRGSPRAPGRCPGTRTRRWTRRRDTRTPGQQRLDPAGRLEVGVARSRRAPRCPWRSRRCWGRG